jgi:putative DNA primase/helicase
MTKITTATPGGDCPQWMAFLSDITGGDADLQAYLQRMVGYCLTGVTSARAVLPVRHGCQRQERVRQRLSHHPRRLRRHGADGHLRRNAHRPAPDRSGGPARRALRDGHRNRAGTALGESKVKAITGGDKISARFMRQDFFEFTRSSSRSIVGNHKPAIRNIDEAMKRRLHMIPFTVTIPPERRDQDPATEAAGRT